MVRKKPEELIGVLMSNEKMIGELYKTFSRKFPTYKQFWFRLAIEENAHATWLRILKSATKKEVTMLKGREDLVLVAKTTMSWIKRKIRESQSKEITFSEALALALELERSLVEKKFFTIFKTDSPQIKEVFTNLAKQTNEHIKQIQKEYLKNTIKKLKENGSKE